MYGKLPGRPAGPPIDYFPTIHRRSDSFPAPFLIGKAIIGRFSKKEWTSEDAYGGNVDENGWFSFSNTCFALTKVSIPSLKIDK